MHLKYPYSFRGVEVEWYNHLTGWAKGCGFEPMPSPYVGKQDILPTLFHPAANGCLVGYEHY